MSGFNAAMLPLMPVEEDQGIGGSLEDSAMHTSTRSADVQSSQDLSEPIMSYATPAESNKPDLPRSALFDTQPDTQEGQGSALFDDFVTGETEVRENQEKLTTIEDDTTFFDRVATPALASEASSFPEASFHESIAPAEFLQQAPLSPARSRKSQVLEPEQDQSSFFDAVKPTQSEPKQSPDLPTSQNIFELGEVDVGQSEATTAEVEAQTEPQTMEEEDPFAGIGFASQAAADTSGDKVQVSNPALEPIMPTEEEDFDLDAELGEFDIDAELGDEFAELEASFQTPSAVASPKPPSPRVPYVNPYRPTGEAVAAYQAAPQQASHVFTPANASSVGRTNAYAPPQQNQPIMPARFSPVRPSKPSTPSFVNAKSTYTDPYALPESFVAPKRMRPPTHALKNAQSVPDLRNSQYAPQQPRAAPGMSSLRQQAAPSAPPSAPPTVRPPTGNRYVSMPQVSQLDRAGQQLLSQGQPPQQQQYKLSPYQPAQTSAMQPQALQQGPSAQHGQVVAPPTRYHAPSASQQTMPSNAYAARPPSRSRPPAMHERGDSMDSIPATNQFQQDRRAYSPSAVRNPGDARHSMHRPSFDQDRQRRLSSASATTSDDREHAMGQYLQSQQGAERTMHLDQFSVVEEEITASQLQQGRPPSGYTPPQQQLQFASQQQRQYAPPPPQQQYAPQQLQFASQHSSAADEQLEQAHPPPPPQQRSNYAPSSHADIPQQFQQRGYAPQQPNSYGPPLLTAEAQRPVQPASDHNGPPVREQYIPSARTSPDHSKGPFGRRSLDAVRPGKTALEMSRPNSRASSSGRAAATEPSFSPRPAKSSLYHPGGPVRASSTAPSRVSTVYAMTSSSDANRTLDSPHPKASFAFGGRLVVCPAEQPNAFSHASAIPRPVTVMAPDSTLASSMLSDFVGPLIHGKQNAKQKKSEAQAWFTSSAASTQDDSLRLLYRLLALMLEHNGQVLQTTMLVAELCPEMKGATDADDSASFRVPAAMLQPVIPEGARAAALQYACEHRLWSHALLVASRLDGDAWISVVREFTQAEFAEDSDAAQSLSFLYKSLAVRNTQDLAQLGASDFKYGSRSWRKSLAMLLANDKQALLTLPAFANALLAQGQIFPSLICQVLLCKPAISPGLLDEGTAFLFKNLDVLSGRSGSREYNAAFMCAQTVELLTVLVQPKFAGYIPLMSHKLQHVQLLADCGAYAQAHRYCDALTATLKQLPRQGQKDTVHIQPAFIEQLKQLTMQLDALSSDEPGAWLTGRVSKGKMDSIWGSLEGKFNKFIAGDGSPSVDGSSDVATGGGVLGKGPFAHVLPTPTISRIGSAADLTYGGSITASPIHEMQPQPFAPGPYAEPAPVGYGLQAAHIASQYAPAQGGTSLRRETSGHGHNAYAPAQQQQQARPFSPAVGGYAQSEPQGLGIVRQGSYSEREPYNQEQGQRPGQKSSYGSYVPSRRESEDGIGQHQRFAPAQPQQQYAPQQLDQASEVRDAVESRYQPVPPISEAATETEQPTTPNADANKEAEKSDKTKQSEADKAATASPKSTWLGGWFSKKEKAPIEQASKPGEAPKVHKAKLGEGMSLVYDPVTKKWTNPKGSMPEEKTLAGPPPPSLKPKAAAGPGGMPPRSQAPLSQGMSAPSSQVPVSAAGAPPVRPSAVAAARPNVSGNADADLAAILGAGSKPRPRRAGVGPPGGGTSPSTAGGEEEDMPMRGSATMPNRRKPRAKGRYVDVFSEGAPA